MNRFTLANYLLAAADIFDRDAKGQPDNIAKAFKTQARDARRMADEIEHTEADSIRLEG